jgi:hypothetical protein
MPTTTATTTQPDGEHLLNEITRHVFLVLLHISWPKLAYQIAGAIVQVEGEDNKKEIAEKFRSKPQWQLMPEEWKKKLGSLENRARALVSSASVQFAARGMAVLPVVRAAEIFAALRTCRTEMELYRDQFVEAYEKILTDLEAELGKELYAKASKKLPSKDDVKSKFGITWAIVPAGGHSIDRAKLAELRTEVEVAFAARYAAGGARVRDRILALIGELESSDVSQITDQEAEDLVREAREQMHQFTQEMLEDMAREPRQILADAANNLIEALSDQTRVIRNGTIDQVRRAFQMVEGFSFLAGPELLDRMERVRERLDGATPQELNSNVAAGAALANALRGVRDAAADAQGASEAMRNFRGIRIRSRETANAE